MKKIRPVKNTWYDWLIDFIPDPIRKSVGGFKHTIVSSFKANSSKKKKDTLIGDIWALFATKEEEKDRNHRKKT